MLPYQPGSTPRARHAPFWPHRVLLIGGESVVSRALLIYLRKEGLDAAIVSEDPALWPGELIGRPHSLDSGAAPDSAGLASGADAVILGPMITGARRRDLCQRLRGDARTRSVPIVALHDAGDDRSPSPGVDADVAWPYRLREVLGVVDSLIRSGAHAESA